MIDMFTGYIHTPKISNYTVLRCTFYVMSIYINKLLLKLPGPDSTLELAEPEARSTPALFT